MKKSALAIVTALGLAHGSRALAIPYSEQDAWCVDKSQGYYSQYDATRAYNKCMKTAVKQIREYHRRREEWKRGAPERERKAREERARRKAEEDARMQQIKEERRQKELAKQREIQKAKQEEADFWNTFE